MFTKHQESRCGADWEWHILGRRRVLKMRVQAKRLQRDNVLKVKHTVASSGSQQRDLLIDGALADGMKPVYCVYCTEPQRSFWTQQAWPGNFAAYQAGCLLADAEHVPLTATRLGGIEDRCIPWHFLFHRFLYARDVLEDEYVALERDQLHFMVFRHSIRTTSVDDIDATIAPDTRWNPPTVRDLNETSPALFDRTGVHETTDADRAMFESDSPTMRSGEHMRNAFARGVWAVCCYSMSAINESS